MAATNYAQLFGIQNRWAPILFAVLYFFALCWYSFQTVRRRSSIYAALAFFSILRLIAFSLRAALANNHNDQTNRGIGIAYSVFYNLGFFSLLLSAYNLLHNRRKVVNTERGLHRVANIFHRGGIFHFLLFLAVLLGLVGIITSLRGENPSAGNSLSHASVYIFLIATVVMAILAAIVIHLERTFHTGLSGNATGPGVGTGAGNGAGNGMISRPLQWAIMALLATLLLLRTIFFAATAHRRKNGLENAQSNEHFWFPLAALTELLVILAFLLPGLVPLRSVLGHHHLGNNEKHTESVTGMHGSGAQPGYGGNAARGQNVV